MIQAVRAVVHGNETPAQALALYEDLARQERMKVAVWYNNRDIRIEERPIGRPGPREMLVKVMACGICGSDVVEWYRLPARAARPGARARAPRWSRSARA